MNIKTRLILSVIFSTITIVGCQGIAAKPKPVGQQTTQEFKLFSPDKNISILITLDDKISYSVAHNDTAILTPSPISMTIDKTIVLGATPNLVNTKSRTVNKKIKPTVPEKRKTIIDNFNEIKLNFTNKYSLTFRAYNDGVAYRFTTGFNKEITVTTEEVTFNFAKNHLIYYPTETSFQTHMERLYETIKLNDIPAKKMGSIPALLEIENGLKVAITEADLEDYAGMFIRGSSNNSLHGIFPAVALAEEVKIKERNIIVTKRADYIAKTKGKRTFPWRTLIIAESDAELLDNQLVFKLAKPLQLKDTSWIKPGKVAWDWWNANNIYGVDFRAGVNTETYKYYIDFASKYGIEYIILDEGWYVLGDLMDIVPEMDIEELFRYAKEKNVGIIPWVVWKTLDKQLDEAMDQFEKWGAVGIKVDFMQRDDQAIVNYYHKIAREAAKRHMLVDFHGSYKPCGLRRAWPNAITREGVKGLENCKWGKDITPEHDLTIPFIRMLAGPMDFTPGAMNNTQQERFEPIFTRPMSQGTRCHQLAMFVIYESPLQMLCDSPSNYLREPECMEFLSAVPAIWDETIVLDAKIADYAMIARQSGNDWYVGAMTDGTAREMTVDLSFLPAGQHTITIFQDGINADNYASDYKKIVKKVSNNDKLKIKLAPGGGFVARITK